LRRRPVLVLSPAIGAEDEHAYRRATETTRIAREVGAEKGQGLGRRVAAPANGNCRATKADREIRRSPRRLSITYCDTA